MGHYYDMAHVPRVRMASEMKPFDYEKMKKALKFNGLRGSADQLYQWESACKVMSDYDLCVSQFHDLKYTGHAISYEITTIDVRIVVIVADDEFFVRRVQRDYPHLGIRALCSDLSYAMMRNHDIVSRGCGWDSTEWHVSTVYNEVRNPVSRWIK